MNKQINLRIMKSEITGTSVASLLCLSDITVTHNFHTDALVVKISRGGLLGSSTALKSSSRVLLEREFFVVVPRLWNSFPTEVHLAPSLYYLYCINHFFSETYTMSNIC